MPDAKAKTAETILPEGTLVRVSMEVRLPCAADRKHVEEWLSYNVGQTGMLNGENPLSFHETEAWGSSFDWQDTGLRGRREEYGHEDLGDGSTGYSVRYHRDRRV